MSGCDPNDPVQFGYVDFALMTKMDDHFINLVNQVDEVIVHLGHQSKVHISELNRVIGIAPAHGRCQM